ncbi:MAG: hypothetical protein J0H67_02125 [Rhodospirillales bacterium]|nr:hypothetical protein [Rhodospirillales bacterium]
MEERRVSDAVRCVWIDGQPWFVLVDVRRVLALPLGSRLRNLIGEDERLLLRKDPAGDPTGLFAGTAAQLEVISGRAFARLLDGCEARAAAN